MRNFRKAALAGATAVAVAFGSTAVATAATEGTEAPEAPAYTAPVRPVEDKDSKDGVEPASSNKIVQSEWLEFRDKDGNLRGTDGEQIFGSQKDNFGDQPRYARLAYGATIFTAVSAVVGLIVGPLYNYFVHGDFQF
ncbi:MULTISPECIES: hypothetical protein [Corynebacterium]|uniref:Or membrane protein n=2 Tax=Corynebacterium TaxID=1716 RepID=A0A7W2I3G5_9CORY|nr:MULTISPECIES: hypothetical protein [Corynebacterium]MBA5243965.1 hypothetical protein [Corynebacterium haemomassiliense]MCG7236153.1 hypothetical protein [Corynebacterium sp. ACRQP]MCZ9292106.1 hypothetical protein [Corynebacterium lehmanniae]MDL0402480.1 hypothetical protein [Corynebacterium lehmanniae]